MTKKRTDGGHEIPEEDLREMEQEEGREMPDGVESQTGYCRFCGQAGMVHTLTGWSQEDVDEAVTCKCECDAACNLPTYVPKCPLPRHLTRYNIFQSSLRRATSWHFPFLPRLCRYLTHWLPWFPLPWSFGVSFPLPWLLFPRLPVRPCPLPPGQSPFGCPRPLLPLPWPP